MQGIGRYVSGEYKPLDFQDIKSTLIGVKIRMLTMLGSSASESVRKTVLTKYNVIWRIQIQSSK